MATKIIRLPIPTASTSRHQDASKSDAEMFNFDEMASLCKKDPERFEQRRRELINNCINGSSNPDKLRKLQWRVDGVIRRSKTPLQACINVSDLMWEHFLKLNEELNRLTTTAS